MRLSEPLRNPKLFWLFWGLIAASWQASSLKNHNGGTGSETTRALFRTHTKAGKAAFIAGFLAFCAWFPRHILYPVGESLSAISGGLEDNDSNSSSQAQLG